VERNERVGLELLISRCDVRKIGRRERDFPVHENDVVGSLGEGSNRVDSRSLASQREGGHLDRLEKAGSAGGEDLVH